MSNAYYNYYYYHYYYYYDYCYYNKQRAASPAVLQLLPPQVVRLELAQLLGVDRVLGGGVRSGIDKQAPLVPILGICTTKDPERNNNHWESKAHAHNTRRTPTNKSLLEATHLKTPFLVCVLLLPTSATAMQ